MKKQFISIELVYTVIYMLAHIFEQKSKRKLKFPGSISGTLCAISAPGSWSWLLQENHAMKVMCREPSPVADGSCRGCKESEGEGSRPGHDRKNLAA